MVKLAYTKLVNDFLEERGIPREKVVDPRNNAIKIKDFLKYNPHARGEVKFLESISREGINAIDIGANIGITTVTIAKKIGRGPGSRIVFEEGDENEKVEVPTTTIDRFLSEEKVERIDLINMDCEGSELLALKGAKETLG